MNRRRFLGSFLAFLLTPEAKPLSCKTNTGELVLQTRKAMLIKVPNELLAFSMPAKLLLSNCNCKAMANQLDLEILQ